jgi:energy-converting hydrogenase Eha subunit C
MLSQIKIFTSKLWIREAPLIVLLLLAGLYFTVYYISDPIRPSLMLPAIFGSDNGIFIDGWWGYYDQGSYLRLAHTLASFNFQELSNTFSFGLGYPIVAVPFIWLGFGRDPFLFFNLLAFVFSVYAVYVTARRLISPFAGYMAGFGLAFATPLISYTAQPWNSTVCLVGISGILLIATSKKVNNWHALIAGILIGWVFAARYIDLVWFAALMPAVFYRGNFKNLVKHGLFVILGAAICILPILYSHYKVFGSPLETPYSTHLGINDNSSDQDAGAYSYKRIPKAALAMFISPRLAGSKDIDRGLFVNMFWTISFIPGAIILLKRPKTRFFIGSLLAVTLLASLFYLSFRASGIHSLKYGILHYFKMFWPGLIIMSVSFLDYAYRLTVSNVSRPRQK